MQLFDPADFVHTWRPRDAGRGAGKPPPPLGPTPQGNASTLPPRIAFTGNLNQHSGLGGKEDFTHTGLTAIKREGPRSTMPSRTAPFISRLRLLRTAAALSPFSSSAPPRHSPRILRASLSVRLTRRASPQPSRRWSFRSPPGSRCSAWPPPPPPPHPSTTSPSRSALPPALLKTWTPLSPLVIWSPFSSERLKLYTHTPYPSGGKYLHIDASVMLLRFGPFGTS